MADPTSRPIYRNPPRLEARKSADAGRCGNNARFRRGRQLDMNLRIETRAAHCGRVRQQGQQMLRRFLWGVVILTVLLGGAALVWQFGSERIIRMTFTPGKHFGASQSVAAPDYAAAASWLARPDLAGNPALWTPEGYRTAPNPQAAVFFVSPTAWISRKAWNSPLDDAATNDRLALFAQMQASVFNGIADIWIPRYRQATLGAFLTPGADADQALALAYGDVERAFASFLAAQGSARPIILAGHSQGALHLLHLLQAHRAELGERLVAVYAVGWPVVEPGDSQAIGVPACTSRDDSGCLLGWMTYAADGDYATELQRIAPTPDLAGQPIGKRPLLCVNPLTGSPAAAARERNLGTLQGEELVPHLVGARCDASGVLLIAPTPTRKGRLVLPGGNYHIYDYSLFWANIRADAEVRLSAWDAAHGLSASAH